MKKRTGGPRFWQRAIVWTVIASATGAYAQPAPHSDVVLSEQQTTDAELFRLTNGTLRIKPCGGEVVRVTFVPGPSVPDLSNPALPDSACPATSFSVYASDRSIEVVTAALRVDVGRNSSAVCFSVHGKLMLAETDWPFPRSVISTTTDGRQAHAASEWFALTSEGRVYGLGQHQTGLMNERNTELVLSQDNTNISIPILVPFRGYGVLWNSASVTDLNHQFRQVVSFASNDSDAVDYYYIGGPSVDKIIAGYRRLSGTAPLFPRWAYGYWQSKLAAGLGWKVGTLSGNLHHICAFVR